AGTAQPSPSHPTAAVPRPPHDEAELSRLPGEATKPFSSPAAGVFLQIQPLGRRLAGIILASRKLEYHMEKELGRLFSEERKNTEMYGQKELEEILATMKALAEPARESAEHA
ncbi:unnamed protein product, partial [Urochloa humidicola]